MKIEILALSVWKIRRWLTKTNADKKLTAEKALLNIERLLEDEGVSFVDLTGRKYDPGMAVEVVGESEDDENQLIIETVQPLITQNGKVVVRGQVKLGKEIKPDVVLEPTKQVEKGNWIWVPYLFIPLLLLFIWSDRNTINFFAESLIQKNNELIEAQGRIDDQEIAIDELKQTQGDLESQINQLEEKLANSYTIITHRVQRGETLISICRNYGIDYYTYRPMILEMNQLKDENHIIAGQTLLIVRKGNE